MLEELAGTAIKADYKTTETTNCSDFHYWLSLLTVYLWPWLCSATSAAFSWWLSWSPRPSLPSARSSIRLKNQSPMMRVSDWCCQTTDVDLFLLYLSSNKWAFAIVARSISPNQLLNYGRQFCETWINIEMFVAWYCNLVAISSKHSENILLMFRVISLYESRLPVYAGLISATIIFVQV